MIRLSSFSVIACYLLLLLNGCSDNPSLIIDPRTRPPLIRISTVQATQEQYHDFTGVVAARFQGDLGFRVSGKILERLVNKGQSVKCGQLLMRLDPVDLALQARAAQNVVNAALARARQTNDDEQRYQGLVSTGAVSVSAYNQIRAAADVARADLSATQAQARVALNASQYTVLTADSDGVIVETLADPGQVVSAGQIVVRLARAGRREAMVSLPETMRPAIGTVAIAGLYGSKSISEAKLRELSDSADTATRTYEARYVLNGPAASAPFGSTVTLRIREAVATTAPVWNVPLSSVWDKGKGPGIWVLEGKSTKKVAWRTVKLLSISDDRVHVAGALQQGEQVVTLGAHLLHEGEVVRISTSQYA